MSKTQDVIKHKIAERIIIKSKELTEAGYGKKHFTMKGDCNHADYSISEEGHTEKR